MGYACHLVGYDFPGRDALLKIEKQPRRLTRIGLELSGRRVPRQGCPILTDTQRIGEVTSGTFSPTLQKPIAMGYVPPEFAKPGRELKIDIRGHLETARVVALPFYNRNKKGKSKVNPQQLLYTKTHEWADIQPDPAGGKIATVGITAFAIEVLTDLVFISLPEVGRQVRAGEPFGEIESVKAVSDLVSPVDGEIVAVNADLANQPRNPFQRSLPGRLDGENQNQQRSKPGRSARPRRLPKTMPGRTTLGKMMRVMNDG